METLNQPSAWLERAVRLATPPAAREAVLGDLCETFSSDPHYAVEALRSVPFVILSQMRRNANLPALGVQGLVVFVCAGGLSFRHPGLVQFGLVALVLAALLLRGAYQPIHRPSARRAIIEAIAVAYGALVYSQGAMVSTVMIPHLTRDDALLGMQFGYLVPLVPPLLCLFRTSLIVRGDGNKPFPVNTVSQDDIVDDYARFRQRIVRRNRQEAVALGIAALAGLTVLRTLPLAYASLGLALVIVYALAAFYLPFEGAVRVLPAGADFLSLRALYAQELARQQQHRRFLWWLWLAPALMTLCIAPLFAGGPALFALGSAAAILLCFAISALNREQGGWVQEKIAMLDRVWEQNRAAPPAKAGACRGNYLAVNDTTGVVRELPGDIWQAGSRLR